MTSIERIGRITRETAEIARLLRERPDAAASYEGHDETATVHAVVDPDGLDSDAKQWADVADVLETAATRAGSWTSTHCTSPRSANCSGSWTFTTKIITLPGCTR